MNSPIPVKVPASMSSGAEFEAFASALLKRIEPAVFLMAKQAAATFAPAPAPFIAPLLDGIDQMIRAHNPSIAMSEDALATVSGVPGPQPVALPDIPHDANAARITALEAHVAALTLVTGHATSAALQTVKAQIIGAVPGVTTGDTKATPEATDTEVNFNSSTRLDAAQAASATAAAEPTPANIEAARAAWDLV